MRRFFICASICVLCLLLLSAALNAQDMAKIEQLMKGIHLKLATGLEYQQKEKFEAAANEYEEALKLEEEMKKLVIFFPGFEKTMDDQILLTHNNAAYCYQQFYSIDKAIHHYSLCLLIAEKYNDSLKQINIYCDLACLFRDSNNYLSFEEVLKRLISVLAWLDTMDTNNLSLNDKLSLIRVIDRIRCICIDYVGLLCDMKKYDEALKSLDANWFIQINASLDKMDIDKFDLIVNQARKENPEALLDIFTNCYTIYQDNINSHFLIATLKGKCLRAKGDYEEALVAFNEAGNHIRLINPERSQKMLASICDELARTAEALDPKSAQAIRRVMADMKYQSFSEEILLFSINNRYHKGRTYLKMGNTGKALELFDEILKDCDRLSPNNQKRVIPRILSAKGEALANQGKNAEASQILQKASGLCGETPLLAGERIRTETILGRIQEKDKKPGDARSSYEKAIGEIEKMHSSLFTGQTREEFFGDDIEPYEGMIRLLLNSGNSIESLGYVEKTKARSLSEQFGMIAPERGLTKAQKKNYESQIYKMNRNYEQLATMGSTGGVDDGAKKVESERRLFDLGADFIKMILNCADDYKDIVCASVVSTKEVQAALDNDTVILEYFYDSLPAASQHAYLWVVTSTSVEALTLPASSSDLEKAIRSMRKAIADRDPKWTEISKTLYTALIEPAEKTLKGKKRIVVSPYRQLHYLPFNTLINRQEQPLVECFSLVYTPSMTALNLCQKKNPALGNNLAAFALGNVSTGNMSPLPGTDKEVRAIGALYPGTTMLMGNDFTKESIPTALPGKNIVHFATHSVLNADDPKASSLITSNGRFTVEEIFGLKIQSRLVVLSACNTGLGRLFPGDDQIGLTRAFMFAGTPSILSSLWPVSDDSTAKLMTYFYQNLSNRMDKAEALRQAELTLMKEYHLPYYWAPFILTGDWK